MSLPLMTLAAALLLWLPDIRIIRRGPPPAAAGGANLIYYVPLSSTSCASASEASSYACANTIAVSNGNTAYVWCSGYGTATVNSVSDGVNTYTALVASLSDGGNARGRLFRASNMTGGTYTVKCNYSAAVWPGMAILTYSGITTPSPGDGTNTNAGTSNTPCAGSITATNANDLILTCATTSYGSTLSWTPPTGFTLRQYYDNGSLSTTFACADRLTTAIGTYGGPFSLAASTAWVAAVAAEKSQ